MLLSVSSGVNEDDEAGNQPAETNSLSSPSPSPCPSAGASSACTGTASEDEGTYDLRQGRLLKRCYDEIVLVKTDVPAVQENHAELEVEVKEDDLDFSLIFAWEPETNRYNLAEMHFYPLYCCELHQWELFPFVVRIEQFHYKTSYLAF